MISDLLIFRPDRINAALRQESRFPPRGVRVGAILAGFLCLWLALIGPAPAAAGQANGEIDLSFDPGSGLDSIPVIYNKVDYQDGSGRSLVYGSFSEFNGSSSYASLERLFADGTRDLSFYAGWILSDGSTTVVRDVQLLPNGQILVGGHFYTNSSPYYVNLCRLNGNGTVDTTFNYTSIGNIRPGAVNSIGVQSDGKILVGGYQLFLNEGGASIYHLMRLQADGTLDYSYPVRATPNGYVTSVKITAGDGALILGTLTRAGDWHVDYLLALDKNGAVQANLGDETLDGPILDMAQQGNGKWIIVGQFRHISGTARNRVARLNPDWSLDPSFDPGAGPNGRVSQVVVQADDRIVLAGDFDSISGVAAGNLARLEAGGAVDPSFNPGGAGADDRIFGLKNNGGAGWTVCGAFQAYNGSARAGLAALTPDGALTTSYAGITTQASGTVSHVVNAMLLQQDGKILVGGNFNAVRHKYHGGFARLNPDGSLDPSFKGDVEGYVTNMSLQPDGKVLLGGRFVAAQGYGATSVARLNPDSSLDPTFLPRFTNPSFTTVDIDTVKPVSFGRQVMVGGYFNAVNGVGCYNLVRLDNDGAYDYGFSPELHPADGTDFRVTRVVEAGGNYLVGGNYGIWSPPYPKGFFTRLLHSGALDPAFGSPGSPWPHVIELSYFKDLALQTDGRILVSVAMAEPYGLSRYSADGMPDNTFRSPSYIYNVYSIAPQGTGQIMIGGYFGADPVKQIGANRVARLNPDGSDSFLNSPDPWNKGCLGGYPTIVNSVVLAPGGKALLGGVFSSYNGTPRAQMVRILTETISGNFGPGIPLLLLSD